MLLDQHLDVKDAKLVLGTDYAAALKARGFSGFVCIASGGSEEDLAHYATLPGVDQALSKKLGMRELAARITAGYFEKRAALAAAAGTAAAAGGGGGGEAAEGKRARGEGEETKEV